MQQWQWVLPFMMYRAIAPSLANSSTDACVKPEFQMPHSLCLHSEYRL